MLAALLLVARHHNHLDLLLHHEPPPVVDGVGERALAGDVGVAATRPLDVVGIDVVAPGDAGVLRQLHPAVVEGEDVFVAVLLPVGLPVPLRARILLICFEFIAECF